METVPLVTKGVTTSAAIALSICFAGIFRFRHQNASTVKPVYNGHLYNELYYLWFIQ